MDQRTDVEKIWKLLGPLGLYQMIHAIILLVDIFPWAFHGLSYIFAGYRPDYLCKTISNSSALSDNYDYIKGSLDEEYGKCSISLHNNTNNVSVVYSCIDGYNYSVPKDRTIITDFDLVCEQEALGELTQTLLLLGQGIGAAVFTPMADTYGRKPIHIICHVSLVIVGISMAYAPNYTSLVIFKVLTGIFIEGLGLTGTILLLEIFPTNIRGYAFCFGLLFWTTGCVLLTPFGYLFRNISWRYMQIALTLVSVYSIAEIWLLDESLRWLIATGKNDKAKKIIEKAAKWNRVDANVIFQQVEQMNPTTTEENVHVDENEKMFQENGRKTKSIEIVNRSNTENPSPLHIFKNKHLLITSLISWYTWIVNSLTYYSLMLISSQLAGNRFLNYFLYALVEYPAFIIESLLIYRIGRQKTCILFHALVAVSLIVASILMTVAGDNPAAINAVTVFSLLGKLGITGSFSTIFLYTPELYPTSLRNAGTGMSSAAARIGGMVAPFSMNLYRYAVWAPGAIFGGMSLVVTFLLMYLPETSGTELPQTIDDINEWHRTKKMGKNTSKKKPNNKNNESVL